jgi:hypothetical protein
MAGLPTTFGASKNCLSGLPMAKRRQAGVWVVVHCEIMQFGDVPSVDEMVFHVASSRPRAEAYCNGVWVAPYSWWKPGTEVPDNERAPLRAKRGPHMLMDRTGRAVAHAKSLK